MLVLLTPAVIYCIILRISYNNVVQETKARLANIFKMIGDKASTERGLVELWHFQHDHPDTDINPHLARTSSQFRHYIQRGLSKVDKRMGGISGVQITFVSCKGISTIAC